MTTNFDEAESRKQDESGATLDDVSMTLNAEQAEIPPEPFAKDNGIFDFMTIDKAIELYKKISTQGIPDLEWKFYGRRKPADVESENNQTTTVNQPVQPSETGQKDDIPTNTEFDFDDEFAVQPVDTSAMSDSLQLKKRPEPGSERKTNLSDIMSDIMKETSLNETQ